MRRILLLAIASTLAVTNASAQQGYYFGFQMGNATTNLSSPSSGSVRGNANAAVNSANNDNVVIDGTTYRITNPSMTAFSMGNFKTSTNDSVISSRLFGGYQYSDFLAIEVGYLYIRDQNTKYTSTSSTSMSATATAGGVSSPMTATFGNVSGTNTYNEKALDLFFKAIWPWSEKFSAYTKIGGAIMNTSIKRSYTINDPSSVTVGGVPSSAQIGFTQSTTSKANKFYPGFSIGGNYQFSDLIGFEISWYKLVVDTNDMNNINILFGGLFSNLLNVIAMTDKSTT